ncbi:MAG: type II toxin-antitoxin system VapC family toxin [Solirubrobacteraceae bacterium]
MSPAASSAREPAPEVVVDASALVEALLGTAVGEIVRERIRGRVLHAPAHLDAEVLSALGRLHRAGDLPDATVTAMVGELTQAPIRRHLLAPLLAGAWERRAQLRLVDALYVELADALGSLPLLSTDGRLAQTSALIEFVED